MTMQCNGPRLVDLHFAGEISLDEERTMRDHLATCDRCRERYRRQLLLARIDPGALGAEERLGRALGLCSTKQEPRRVARIVPIAASFLALAAALFLVLRPRPVDGPASDLGFTARGSLTASASSSLDADDAPLSVYRVSGAGIDAAARATGSLGRDDELAFAYRNVDGKPYLMIFGVDDQRHVYWFYPAWTDEKDDPRAIRAETDRDRHELREAIRHPLAGGRLAIHALFLDAPRTVREVEADLARRATEEGSASTLEGSVDHVSRFQVGGGHP